MSVEEVYNIVTRAHQIKKWPPEYRIYSDVGIVFIYCDDIGMPQYYVYHTDGTRRQFSDFESKMLSTKIENRYVELCKIALKDMAYHNKTK